MTDNTPLGKKKNYGLKEASNFKWDYMIEIGSDDIVTDDLLDQYIEYYDKYDAFGVQDICYVESVNLECRRFNSKLSTYGAGRIISRKAIEKMQWKLWDDKINRGLDNDSIRNLKSKNINYFKVPPMDDPGVIDVKSDENIWKFNYFLGSGYDINKILNKLSQFEVDKLMTFQKC
jgi:hypothetical protein